MKVHIGVLGHVVVEHDVDPLDVHSSSEQIGGDEDTLLEVLELLVAGKSAGEGGVSTKILCFHVLF